MLRFLSMMTDASILATDGILGSVSNFLFDDLTWTIRYLVVDTWRWLERRHVLIAIAAVDQPDWEKGVFPVHLTKDQVRRSPEIDTEQPVSRQQEIAMSEYFGWPTYWSARIPSSRYAAEMEYPTSKQVDTHLRSAWDVAGDTVWDAEGKIGQLEDFVLDDASWHLGYLIVSTGAWPNTHNIMISTDRVKSVSWAEQRVTILGPRDMVWGK